MAQHASVGEQERLVVHTRPVIDLDEEQFFQFCQLNRELEIERTAEGDIIITAPEAGSSGLGSSKLNMIIGLWAERDGTGQVFGSSTGFRLPNGATRSPDVAWVRNDRLDALSEEEWHRFLPLCPDFVLELRSPSDSLEDLQRKLEEYRDNGAQLGWLLDPVNKRVHVYRPGATIAVLDNPASIVGEPVLPGFVLDVLQIWPAMERRRNP
jgi:Uma2 family endonuclease